MAFITTQQTQETALRTIIEAAIYAKNVCTASLNQLTGNVGSGDLLSLLEQLRVLIIRMDGYAATPGLPSYAQTQYNSATYNIVTEYNNMRAALVNVGNWISANFPKDGNGFVLAYSLAGDWSHVDRQFTPTQTAGLQSALTAAVATIN